MVLFAMDIVQCIQYQKYKSAIEDLTAPSPGPFSDRFVNGTTVAIGSVMTGSSVHSAEGFRRISAGAGA